MHRFIRICLTSLLLAVLIFENVVAQSADFDLLFLNGTIIDGTGKDRYQADIGIRDGRIAEIGQLADRKARRVIDIKNRVISPGFIDLHSHADRGLVSKNAARRAAPNLVTQGITTVVVNQDGGGPYSLQYQRETMIERGVGLNVIQLMGHGMIRRMAMKEDYRRAATAGEVDRMREMVRKGMEDGAFGISAGLEYVPGRWSTADEMQALVAELKPFNGIYVVHERSSGSRPMWFLPSQHSPTQPSMIDNLNEQIEVARKTGVTVVATHIKARGVDFWGSSRIMIDMIQRARAEGVPIFADQYAYNTSGSDGRIVLIPDWVESLEDDDVEQPEKKQRNAAEWLEFALSREMTAKDVRKDIAFEIARRGGPSSIVVVDHPKEELIGKTLEQLAGKKGCDAVEIAIRLQLEGKRSRRGGARLRAFSMSEADVEAFAGTEWTATSSDAGIALPEDGPVHPRFYGAFTRKIRRYALERERLTLEQAIERATQLPASILRLSDRGNLKPGSWADIVVFDPEEIRDLADAFDPHQHSVGIDFVLIGGEAVVDQGQRTDKLVGRVLSR